MDFAMDITEIDERPMAKHRFTIRVWRSVHRHRNPWHAKGTFQFDGKSLRNAR
jgi:hypothetical protein